MKVYYGWQLRFNVLVRNFSKKELCNRSIKINHKKWTHVKFMNTCLFYEQLCKLTSLVKHSRLRLVKHLRKYPLASVQGLKLREMAFW